MLPLKMIFIDFLAINQIFYNYKCVQIIQENQEKFKDALGEILQNANFAYTYNQKTCVATGYLYLSENFENLHKLHPHTKVIIFHTSKTDFRKLNHTDLLGYRDIEVIYLNFENGEISRPISGGKWIPNLGMRKLRVTGFKFPPFSYVEEGKGFYDGVEKYVLDYITRGIDLEIIARPVYSWNLVRGDMMEGKADVGIPAIWRGTLNYSVVDTTYPYIDVCITLMVPKPTPLPANLFFFNLFNNYIYLLQAGTILTVGSFMFFINSTVLKSKTNFIKEVFNVYKISVMTGGDQIKNFLPLRLLFTFWCFTAILINTWYSAAITKTLSLPLYTRPVRTLEGVHEAGIKLIGKNEETLKLIGMSQDPDVIQLAKGALLYSKTQEYAHAAHMVNRMSDYVEISRYLDITQYNFMMISQCFINDFFVFIIQKDFALKERFNEGINRLYECGLIKAWFRGMLLRDLELAEEIDLLHQVYPPKNDGNLLTLQHILGALSVFMFGISLGLIAFILEFLYNKRALTLATRV